METLTIEETALPKKAELPIVNFLRNDEKCFDWRYNTYEKLSLAFRRDKKSSLEKSIYWIGAIDLKLIHKKNNSYHLLFANRRWQLTVDSEANRYEDGVRSEGYSTIQYHFNNELLEALLKARKERYKYFNILIQETVDLYGNHTTVLLHNKKTALYESGIKTKVPWFKLPVHTLAELSHQEIHENADQLCILSEDEYRWMK